MSDPRHKHEFLPSRKGTCKMYVGGAICKLGGDAPVHKRYEEDTGENNTEKSREQIGDELVELILDDNVFGTLKIAKILKLARQWLNMSNEEE